MRTLALAYRDLTEDEWEAWSESHHRADRATRCREEQLAAVYEEIEQDMMVGDWVFLGCASVAVSVGLCFSAVFILISEHVPLRGNGNRTVEKGTSAR